MQGERGREGPGTEGKDAGKISNPSGKVNSFLPSPERKAHSPGALRERSSLRTFSISLNTQGRECQTKSSCNKRIVSGFRDLIQ